MGLSGMLVVLVFLRLEPTVHPTAWKIAVVEHLLKVTNQTHRRTQTRAPAHGALSDGTQMALRWHSDGTQMALEIRLTQTHSEALRGAHLLNAIEHPLNLHNLVSLHRRVSRVFTAEQQAVHVARYLIREVIRGHPRYQSDPITSRGFAIARYRSHLIRANQSQSEPIRAYQSLSEPISARALVTQSAISAAPVTQSARLATGRI